MKTRLLLQIVLILSSCSLYAHSGDSVIVPFGKTPVIDGVFSQDEWEDAAQISVPSITGKVFIKYDLSKLYIAFENNSYHFQSTGVYIDKLNNGGVEPQSDDMWLHGSAGQYEWRGNLNDSNWGAVSPSGWSYSINSACEYEIDLVKLQVNGKLNNRIGVLFSFLDWSNGSEVTWPNGGFSILSKPNTYADLIFESNPTTIEEILPQILSIHPNPATNQLNIQNSEECKIYIYGVSGNVMYSTYKKASEVQIDVSGWPRGFYVILTIGDKYTRRKRLILN
jgi:hypothetical protein